MNTLSFWATGNNVIHKKLKPGNWAYCFAEYLAVCGLAFLALTTFNNANALVPAPFPSLSLPSPLGDIETTPSLPSSTPPVVAWYTSYQVYAGSTLTAGSPEAIIDITTQGVCAYGYTMDQFNLLNPYVGVFHFTCKSGPPTYGPGHGFGGSVYAISKCFDVVVPHDAICKEQVNCPDPTWIHYDEAAGMCWKPKPVPTCPEHASGPPCVCDEGYKLNENNECVCFIDDLPELGNDACTQALETGNKATIERDCPKLNPKLTDPLNGQIQCLADKIHKLGIAYNGPTATIRTEAYQKHFVEVWAKWNEIKNRAKTDAIKLACTEVIAKVTNEMKTHGIDAQPSNKGAKAPHVLGIAFDIPRSVSLTMMEKSNLPKLKAFYKTYAADCIACQHIPLLSGDVQDYVNSSTVNPPACDLMWGGRWKDKVHFQLIHP